jgi:hypothetical protein
MPFVNVFGAGVIWFCALIFGAIALWAFKRRDPMHFWSGSTVRPEEITDIPAYNRANGWLWTLYAVCMAAAGVVLLFHVKGGVVLAGIVCFLGIPVLIVVYKRIYNKYRAPAARESKS